MQIPATPLTYIHTSNIKKDRTGFSPDFEVKLQLLRYAAVRYLKLQIKAETSSVRNYYYHIILL